MSICPGWYCGKTLLEDGSLSDCGSCLRGSRRNESFICEPCTDDPQLYDWLYLGFMVLAVLVLHWFFIDVVTMRRSFSKEGLTLYIVATIEVLISSLLSVVLIDPFGKLKINSCTVRSINDWYTLLHNPNPNYEETIHCTQEAVYPLYTIIFLFYSLNLVVMLFFRTWICRKWLPKKSRMSIYAAMYFLPILGASHIIIGGLLYYSFPYLIIVFSVISCAAHFAANMNQTVISLVKTTFTNPRNLVILLGHWGLHAYGIIALTQFTEPLLHSLLFLLVPLPTIFYILTARFTNPNNFSIS